MSTQCISLAKTYPGGKEVLRDISLSFLPGAKIGVLGLNGAGKSTLLKIMAGIETDFTGEAKAADGLHVGYLAQEPELDPSMDVQGNVMSGMGEAKELVDRFNEVSARFAEELTDDEMNEVIAEQAELQEKLMRWMPGILNVRPRSRWTHCVCQMVEQMSQNYQAVNAVVWPCVAFCYLRLICCFLMSQQTI